MNDHRSVAMREELSRSSSIKSWFKSFVAPNSKILEDEKLRWSKPHELIYDPDLRQKQLNILKNSFGLDLQLCQCTIDLSGIIYEHYFVTDRTHLIEFGSGDLKV